MLRLLCLLVLTSAASAIHAAEISEQEHISTHAREFEVSPVSMSYEELAALIAGTHDIIEKANAGVPQDQYLHPIVSLSVAAGEDSVKTSDWTPITAEKALPPIAREVRFLYHWDSASPIAEVSVSLTDGARVVNVEGTDSAQVAALAEYLRNSLGTSATLLGGLRIRMPAFYGLMLLFILLSFVLSSRAAVPLKVVGAVLPISIPFIAFGLPWEVWLPGTAVVSGSASWVDRHANLLTVLGFFLSLAAVLSAAIARLRRVIAEESAKAIQSKILQVP